MKYANTAESGLMPENRSTALSIPVHLVPTTIMTETARITDARISNANVFPTECFVARMGRLISLNSWTY